MQSILTPAAQLKLEVAQSPREAMPVLCNPDIYEVISCDGAPPIAEYEPEEGPIYLLGKVNNETIGVMVLHQFGGFDWWVHFQVLPQFRKEWAKKFGYQALRFAFRELENCKKLNAQIPIIYTNVVLFSQTFGFRFEGVNRQSYYKNGKCYDQHYMGLLPWDLLDV